MHKAYIVGYEDGTFRPDGNITRAETSAILARLTDGFNESSWFLVFVAWKANTKAGARPVLSWFVIVLCVMIFVLARFEHSIASAYIMFAAGAYDGQSWLCLAVLILGNTVGAVLPAAAFPESQGGGR